MSIYPRTNYEMTEAEETELLDAMKSVPMIMLQCGPSRSQQERANDAWEVLGKKKGFDHMTVRPRDGYGQRHFTAIPSETENQRFNREQKEAEEGRVKEVADIDAQIKTLADRRAKLLLP